MVLMPVLSLILFLIYTNWISCITEGMTLLNYADDRPQVAHLTDTNTLSECHQLVNNLVRAFEESCLELKISKTKELCCRTRGNVNAPQPFSEPIKLDRQLVEQMDTLYTWVRK